MFNISSHTSASESAIHAHIHYHQFLVVFNKIVMIRPLLTSKERFQSMAIIDALPAQWDTISKHATI